MAMRVILVLLVAVAVAAVVFIPGLRYEYRGPVVVDADEGTAIILCIDRLTGTVWTTHCNEYRCRNYWK